MDLMYEWTAEFKNAEKALPKAERDRLVDLINERGQLFKKQKRSFYKGLTQPVSFRFRYEGVENAFYLLPFGEDWSILLAACIEPYVWKEATLSLYDLVPRAQADEVYEDVVGSYYRAEGMLADESAEANGRSHQAARRFVRSDSGRRKAAANGRTQGRVSRRPRRAVRQ